MKRLLATLLAVALLFTACGNSGEKEAVNKAVTDFSTYFSNFQISEAFTLMTPEEQEKADMVELNLDDPTTQLFMEAFTGFTSQSKVTITDTKVSGDTAVVKVTVDYIDMSGQMENLVNIATLAVYAKLAEMDDTTTLTEDDILVMMLNEIKILSTEGFPQGTGEYTIWLKKIDGIWYIEAYENGYVPALLSFLAS